MKKKMIAVLLAMVTCLSGSAMVNAQTRSAKDKEISSFRVTPFSYNELSYRDKEDNTPLYLWYKTATNNRYTYVYVRAYGTGSENLTMNGDTSSVDHVTCYLGNKYLIRSGIYEAGLSEASLGFKSPNYVEAQTIGGAWSPDSIGSYAYAY